MATVDQRDLPVHLAADLDGRTQLAVLAPARRWRALIDGAELGSSGVCAARRCATGVPLPFASAT